MDDYTDEEPLDIESVGIRTELLQRVKEELRQDNNTILVVDDEMAIRLIVRELIEDAAPEGLEVIEAENGRVALNKLADLRAAGHPDPILIVSDLEMPVLDGWDMIDELEQQYKAAGKDHGIPIVVLSASSGAKGLLHRKSVQAGRSTYSPLVAVAKETCCNPARYDTQGEGGLLKFLSYFITAGTHGPHQA